MYRATHMVHPWYTYFTSIGAYLGPICKWMLQCRHLLAFICEIFPWHLLLELRSTLLYFSDWCNPFQHKSMYGCIRDLLLIHMVDYTILPPSQRNDDVHYGQPLHFSTRDDSWRCANIGWIQFWSNSFLASRKHVQLCCCKRTFSKWHLFPASWQSHDWSPCIQHSLLKLHILLKWNDTRSAISSQIGFAINRFVCLVLWTRGKILSGDMLFRLNLAICWSMKTFVIQRGSCLGTSKRSSVQEIEIETNSGFWQHSCGKKFMNEVHGTF